MPAVPKNRKTAGLALLVLSALALLALSGVFRADRPLSAFCVDESVWQALQAERRAADAPLLTALRFGAHDLLLDTDARHFYYSLIENDPDALDPPVRWQGADGVRVAFRRAAITPDSIAAGAELELLAYTDTACTLYRLSCTTLPLLDIRGVDPAVLTVENRETAVPMDLRLFDNRAAAAQRVVSAQGTIHVRGGLSTTYPKLGYRITLQALSPGNHLREYDTSLLGMRQDGDWLLYAAYNDQEKARNVFCTRLWRQSCAADNVFGVDNGTDFRYVELFFDGRYWGLYALGYPIDARQLRLHSDVGGYTEFLFKKRDWSPSEVGVLPEQPYLLGYDLQNPDANEPEAWRTLLDYYLTLRDTDDPAALRQMCDIGSAVDVYLFFNLIQGEDNVRPDSLKNLMLAFKQRDGVLTALYAPWDMDLTFGNAFVDSYVENYTDADHYGPDVDFLMVLNPVYRLQQLGDAGINGLIKARYAALRADAWSEESLMALLDDCEAAVFDSGAFVRDAARWPDGSYVEPAQKLTALRAHVRARLPYMDAFVAALP